MSSKVIETNLTIDTHNIFGDANSFVGNHSPNEIKGGKIELYRHVAQVNLKSVKISTTNTGATFQLEEVFMANVKGYSHIASKKNILIIGLRRMLLLPVRNCGGMVTTSKMIGMESIK